MTTNAFRCESPISRARAVEILTAAGIVDDFADPAHDDWWYAETEAGDECLVAEGGEIVAHSRGALSWLSPGRIEAASAGSPA